jgi:hypothetical protein
LARTTARYELTPGSHAVLELRSGRKRITSWQLEVVGWIDLDAQDSAPLAGELRMDLATATDPGSGLAVAGLAEAGVPGADRGWLTLTWDSGHISDSIARTAGRELALRTTLVLNSHRSELPVTLSVRPPGASGAESAAPSTVSASAKRAQIHLAEHGLRLRLSDESGGQTSPTTALLSLDLTMGDGTAPRN